MKVLIIRFSSIGDIILTTPVIRCIKQQVPGVELHFVTKRSFKTIMESNPYIDKLHFLDNDLNATAEELKKENFDIVIDLHKNLRTLRMKWKLGVKSFAFDKLNWPKWLLVNLKIHKMPDIHIVDRYMEPAIKALGIKNDNKGLDYIIPAADEVEVTRYGVRKGEYTVYAIGGQHFTKKMPVDKMVELISGLKESVLLIGGKEDFLTAAEIIKKLDEKDGHGGAVNTCGMLNLNQSASLIRQAKYVISHDTGMMHVSAALKKKTFAIWGNTVPELGMYPYLTEHFNLEVKDLSCRPCSKIGYKKCPKGHFKCMNEQTFELISAHC